MEVVDEVAAPHDEHSFLAQGRYTLPDLVVERGRLPFVDAKLHDRNVRLRVYVAQNRPRAVIERRPNIAVRIGTRNPEVKR